MFFWISMRVLLKIFYSSFLFSFASSRKSVLGDFSLSLTFILQSFLKCLVLSLVVPHIWDGHIKGNKQLCVHEWSLLTFSKIKFYLKIVNNRKTIKIIQRIPMYPSDCFPYFPHPLPFLSVPTLPFSWLGESFFASLGVLGPVSLASWGLLGAVISLVVYLPGCLGTNLKLAVVPPPPQP